MNSEPSRAAPERLRAIAWDDLDSAFAHGRSRPLLMREHMRRADLWAHACGTEEGRPFFGVGEYVDPGSRVTYYAKISEGFPRNSQRGILRRRTIGREAETYDEAFTRNLRWEPTESLRLYALGHNEIDHVEITEIEAAAFIESTTKRLAGSPLKNVCRE
ncbi:hypothetical protein [Streptomyces sp. NPDC059802]|uniref:hypothetical protein n=1 Tax=Streptomyces sp. NPDC059802 TaxID=3346952 RepID=UPI003663F20D